jgi:hypothetical protein
MILKKINDSKDQLNSHLNHILTLRYLKYSIKICIVGNAIHCDEAKAAGIDSIDVEGLKAFNK